MMYFFHLLYGFLIAFSVMLSPGMLNMTALKVSLDVGEKPGLKFAIGAAIIIFFQVGIALFFADYFVQHPKIIEIIEEIGVVVFFLLSIFFFRLSKKETPQNTKKVQRNYFYAGVGIASLDMLTIPFYITVSAFLASKNEITIEIPYTFLFMFGVMLGAFTLLYSYVKFANVIARKVSFLTKNINIILSVMFLVLGIVTLIKLL